MNFAAPSNPSAAVKTTCPYCGVGCGIIATPTHDGSLDIKGDPDHPANFGRLCSKGSALGETIDLADRILTPEVGGEQTGWDEALDLVADRFNETIEKYGPDSVAFYVSGQILTEDYYVANKLMKGFIGSANIDTNSRLCMASSVAGHKRAFGSDTVPGTYEDLELADLLVLVGSNLAWCHPVLYQRVAAAKEKRPNMKVVLVDPRRTMTADIADLHLPINPDADIALFLGLLSQIADRGVVDQAYVDAHTNGFVDALSEASNLTLSDIAADTGLSESNLREFYDLFCKTEKSVTIYSQGVNQSQVGTDKVNAIINCHLATGRIGKPGMGPFSVTGQPNAMGGREVGGLANMLAAHLALESEDDRAIVQEFWQAPTIADRPGLKAIDMFDAVADGKIKALWIMATNPVDSLPNANKVQEAIKSCPFVVVSDIIHGTDTVRHADVKLPSLGWGEKDGTVTNSERRISRQKSVLPAPGAAKADWWQLAEVGKRMGFVEAFDYANSSEIFTEHAKLSGFKNNGARDFDISAYAEIDEDEYDDLKPFQWPQATLQKPTETRFFSNGQFYTPDQKARFVDVSRPEIQRSESDLVLNTGRIRDHWHTMTRTGKSERLSVHLGEPFCEIHPYDAARLGIAAASLVLLKTEFGSIVVRALITDRQKRGNVFVPMHWTDQFASNARVDVLVPPKTDPFSGQPALKNVVVELSKFSAAEYGLLITCQKPQNIEADYWALSKCQSGWKLEFANIDQSENLSDLSQKLGLDAIAEPIEYTDLKTKQKRFASFEQCELKTAIFVGPEPVTVSRSWATDLLNENFEDIKKRYLVVAGRAGADQPDKGAIVCSCFSVGANEIAGAVHRGCHTVSAVGEATNAGTNCGSCRAEISEIIHDRQINAAE